MSPTPLVPTTTGCGVPDSVMVCGVAVIVPVVVMVPGVYVASVAGMVSLPEAPPVRKLVDDAVAEAGAVSP